MWWLAYGLETLISGMLIALMISTSDTAEWEVIENPWTVYAHRGRAAGGDGDAQCVPVLAARRQVRYRRARDRADHDRHRAGDPRCGVQAVRRRDREGHRAGARRGRPHRPAGGADPDRHTRAPEHRADRAPRPQLPSRASETEQDATEDTAHRCRNRAPRVRRRPQVRTAHRAPAPRSETEQFPRTVQEQTPRRTERRIRSSRPAPTPSSRRCAPAAHRGGSRTPAPASADYSTPAELDSDRRRTGRARTPWGS